MDSATSIFYMSENFRHLRLFFAYFARKSLPFASPNELVLAASNLGKVNLHTKFDKEKIEREMGALSWTQPKSELNRK